VAGTRLETGSPCRHPHRRLQLRGPIAPQVKGQPPTTRRLGRSGGLQGLCRSRPPASSLVRSASNLLIAVSAMPNTDFPLAQ
jgi:hypothetical protein